MTHIPEHGQLTADQLYNAQRGREARAAARTRRKVETVQTTDSMLTSTASALESAGARAQHAGLPDVEAGLYAAARDLRVITSGVLDLSAVQHVIDALDEADCVRELERVGSTITASNVSRALNDLDVLLGGGKVEVRKFKWATPKQIADSWRIQGEVRVARKLRAAIPRMVARADLPQKLAEDLVILVDARLRRGRVEPNSLTRAVLEYASRWITEYNARAEKQLAWRAPVLLGPAPLVDSRMRPIEGAAAIPIESSETFRLPVMELEQGTWRLEK